MKKIFQSLSIFLLSLFLFGNALAAQPYFGAKTALAKPNSPDFIRIVVYNNTYDTYMVRSVYQPSNVIWDMHLGSVGTTTSSIVYDVTYPDYGICFSIVRDYDGLIVYNGCTSSSDNIYITNMLKNNKPVVEFKK